MAAAFLLLAMSAIAADLPRSPAPAGVVLYFIAPQDGAMVANPVTVRFGLKGMGIAPAGIAMTGTGHHHLLIDSAVPPFDRPIPADDRHLHFGKGQTETVVSLAPGRHRLQLLLGDHLHRPHDPPVISRPITITVE
jgi:hypothetical protein